MPDKRIVSFELLDYINEAFRNASTSRGNRIISLAVAFVDIHVIKRQAYKPLLIVIASSASKNY